jgi:hypothetical protein
VCESLTSTDDEDADIVRSRGRLDNLMQALSCHGHLVADSANHPPVRTTGTDELRSLVPPLRPITPSANLKQLTAHDLKTLTKNANIHATMHTFMLGFITSDGKALYPGPSVSDLLQRMHKLGHTAFSMTAVEGLLKTVVTLDIVKKIVPPVGYLCQLLL